MSALAAVTGRKPRRLNNRRNLSRYKMLYLMMIPGAIWFILFHIVPLYGIIIAFQEFNPAVGIFENKFVGFLNFERFISSSSFPTMLKNTLVISTLKLVLGFPLPIIFALCLNEIHNTMFKRTVQTISYLPYFLSWVIITGLSYTIFNDYTGVIKGFSQALGVAYSDPSKNPDTFVAFIIGSYIWKSIGWSSIMYLSAIAGIDQEIYEAATIDGAGRWRKMLNITLPSIAPTIAILLILSVGSILSSDFEQLYLFQGGQRYNPLLVAVSDTFDTWIYRNGIAKAAYSLPTAAGLFQSFFGAILIFVTNKATKKLGYDGIW